MGSGGEEVRKERGNSRGEPRQAQLVSTSCCRKATPPFIISSHPRRLGGDERKKSEKRGFRIFPLRGGRRPGEFSSYFPSLNNMGSGGEEVRKERGNSRGEPRQAQLVSTSCCRKATPPFIISSHPRRLGGDERKNPKSVVFGFSLRGGRRPGEFSSYFPSLNNMGSGGEEVRKERGNSRGEPRQAQLVSTSCCRKATPPFIISLSSPPSWRG